MPLTQAAWGAWGTTDYRTEPKAPSSETGAPNGCWASSLQHKQIDTVNKSRVSKAFLRGCDIVLALHLHLQGPLTIPSDEHCMAECCCGAHVCLSQTVCWRGRADGAINAHVKHRPGSYNLSAYAELCTTSSNSTASIWSFHMHAIIPATAQHHPPDWVDRLLPAAQINTVNKIRGQQNQKFDYAVAWC